MNSAASRSSQGGERLSQIFGLACLGWGLGWLGTRCCFSWGCDWEWLGVMTCLPGRIAGRMLWAGWVPLDIPAAGLPGLRCAPLDLSSPPALPLPPASFPSKPMDFPCSILGESFWSPPAILIMTWRPSSGPSGHNPTLLLVLFWVILNWAENQDSSGNARRRALLHRWNRGLCCWLFCRQYFFFWGLDIFLASKMTDALFRFQWQRFRFLAPGQEPSELRFQSSSGTLAA